ncbi:MAG: hypothetical protein OHK0012_08920 [Synechococcales cyanobacterium]
MKPTQLDKPATPPAMTLLYDGECPLCRREVRFLQQRDGGRGLVRCVDIAAPDYDPTLHANIDYATAMQRIHAILPDGTVVRNVAAFRHVYEHLGLGWVYALTRIPWVGQWADRVYGWWAERRLALTGRPDLYTVVAQRLSHQTDDQGINCPVCTDQCR